MARSRTSAVAVSVPVNLSDCAREPIHLSGAIQPHGCLLACPLQSWEVTAASENAASFLGIDATRVVGSPAGDLLGPQLLHDLRNTLQGAMISGSAERLTDIRVPGNPRRLDVAIHASGDTAVMEFSDHEGTDTSTTDPIVLVKSMMGRLKRASTLARFLQMAAAQVRSVTGYDRVMIYRFLADHSGEVVAEALRPGLPPFNGLRYPASDIPSQARELYKRQWLRPIVDVTYTPVPIVGLPDATSLDLSLSTLRSVSPVHLEYLRNMGSAATLTVSLMAGDRLWGLIACHHEAPRRIGASTAAATEMFGQVLSLQIEARETAEQQSQAARLRDAHDALIAAMPAEATLFDDLPRFEPLLKSLVPCDGIGVWRDGRFISTGTVPPVSALAALIGMMDGWQAREPVATHRLSELLPLAETFADRVSGMLAIRFSRSTPDYLFFFRREMVQTVVWGGNPTKPVNVSASGRIGPRKSFEAWREQVRGESAPWKAEEVQVVEVLRVSLLDVILRRSDLLNRERKAAQESQSLLIAELNHRVKNVLALIRSLVRQSRQDAQSVEGFTADLEHRIRALAFAHDQLMQVGWRGAPLRRLLEAEIEAWAGAASDRVTIEGPAVTLGSRAYQALALVFHEMMTNAAKYGALSDQTGHLAVRWRLSENGDLVIDWIESGGPSATPPTRRGFGSVIVEQTVPFELQGQSVVNFNPSGVTGSFVVPAVHLVDASQDSDAAPSQASPTSEGVADLSGRRLLLVEDSMMIALDAQSMLSGLGLDVEIAGNVADGKRALQVNSFDAAILDVNLSGETSFPVADMLQQARIPFVFATGYGESIVIPERFAGTAVVAKPYDERSLHVALSTRMAAPPKP